MKVEARFVKKLNSQRRTHVTIENYALINTIALRDKNSVLITSLTIPRKKEMIQGMTKDPTSMVPVTLITLTTCLLIPLVYIPTFLHKRVLISPSKSTRWILPYARCHGRNM